MGLFHNVLMGFGIAFEPMNLFFCFVGVLAGTLVGVLPGIGPTAAIALLLGDLRRDARIEHHHACRHSVRCYVWRFHHVHSGQRTR